MAGGPGLVAIIGELANFDQALPQNIRRAVAPPGGIFNLRS
jgi:hypothetical protein